MRSISYPQFRIVQCDTAQELTEELNKILKELKDYGPEVTFEGLTAHVSYMEHEDAIPENLVDEYKVKGVNLYCEDCPYFERITKKDGTVDHRKKILPCQGTSQKVQAIDIEAEMRLTLSLDIAVEPFRDEADGGYPATLEIRPGRGEIVVIDNLSQLGSVQLLAEVPGSGAAIQVHHRNRYIRRHPLPQEGQVEHRTESHHGHGAYDVDGPACPNAELAADYCAYFLNESHFTRLLLPSFRGVVLSAFPPERLAPRRSWHHTDRFPW